ncbi:MAG: hypothetical protein Q7T33_02560 [Dehalococcoidia bacterium]|nr:hypothetical protein [Dehalococcoidia bacterium]
MAEWGSGGSKMDLLPGEYHAEIVGVEMAQGKDFKREGKTIAQFLFSVNVWVDGAWQPEQVYTGVRFADPSTIREAQYMPKLMKISRACGVRWPTNATEARVWKPECLIGKRFKILAVADPEDPSSVEIKYIPAGQPVAAAAASVDPFAQDAGATPAGQHGTQPPHTTATPLPRQTAVTAAQDPWA